MTKTAQSTNPYEWLVDKVFNPYRQRYQTLSFREKRKIYSYVGSLFPCQKCYDSYFLLKNLFNLEETVGSAAELGGDMAGLAREVLECFPKMKWTSYEMLSHTFPADMDQFNFREVVLNDELWLGNIRLNCDLFVCSHTIEHFSNNDAQLFLDYLIEQEPTHIFLQAPLYPKGQIWPDYIGLHVLTMGSDKVKEHLADSYRVVDEKPRKDVPRTPGIGWCCFWTLRRHKK